MIRLTISPHTLHNIGALQMPIAAEETDRKGEGKVEMRAVALVPYTRIQEKVDSHPETTHSRNSRLLDVNPCENIPVTITHLNLL